MVKGKQLTFEEAIEKLEVIVEKLETGTSLEESLKLFEEGMALIKFCQEKLETAERKVEKLIKTEDGKVSFENFEED